MFTLRDFCEGSGYPVYDSTALLGYNSDVSVISETSTCHFRPATDEGVLLGGDAWGGFSDLLDLEVTGFTYNRRGHQLIIRVDW